MQDLIRQILTAREGRSIGHYEPGGGPSGTLAGPIAGIGFGRDPREQAILDHLRRILLARQAQPGRRNLLPPAVMEKLGIGEPAPMGPPPAVAPPMFTEPGFRSLPDNYKEYDPDYLAKKEAARQFAQRQGPPPMTRD